MTTYNKLSCDKKFQTCERRGQRKQWRTSKSKAFLKSFDKKPSLWNKLFLSSKCLNFYHLIYFPFLKSTIFLNLTPILVCNASSLQLIDDDDHDVIERFVILLHGSTRICAGVNQCRGGLFSMKSRMVENVPPTFDTQRFHIKRAQLQSRWVTLIFLSQNSVEKLIN